MANAGDSLLAETELIARNWMVKGGKRLRPFITLAAYDALTGAAGLQTATGNDLPKFSLEVRRTAMAMEAFHKASLVHDDIQDNDPYRYGQETLHCRYGVGTAINVGDYLIGLRLSADQPGSQGTGCRGGERHSGSSRQCPSQAV